MERNIYLQLQEPAQARQVWFDKIDKNCSRPGSEKLPLWQCAGAVTSKPVLARRSSPAFHGAAMDGYALLAESSFKASPAKPVHLEIGREIWPINTGQPLPQAANAVVMIENVNLDETGKFVILEKAVFPWQHVRKTGEDIVETEVILAQGTVIGASEIGALAAGGVLEPEVFKKARVVIIPTGSDLVPLAEADDESLKQGKVLPEFNSLVFSAMLESVGAEAEVWPIAPDDPQLILKALQEAGATADLILLNAGTSAGSHDFSAHVLQKCGEVLTHGVKMMPGKPVVLGIAEIADRKVPVAGIPGYPVSAFMAMEEFVLPLLAHWQERQLPPRQTMTVYPVNAIASRPGMEERMRVKLGVVDNKAWAVPLARGAGTVTSLSRADAIISIPPESEGLNASQAIAARLLRPQDQIDGALLAIGSHDNTLDLIDSLLRQRHPRFRLTSAHVGSLGGLLALSRNQAHLAGSHLLDSETGLYNRASIKQYLPDVPVALVRLVDREQGLMLAPGNPQGIKNLHDLADGDLRFINRQKGSGTRVLLDYRLSRENIPASALRGYEDEEYTHMNVAQAILSGRADAGLGVRAAANALGLDFIPVGNEEYDLVIPLKYMQDERILALLEVIRSTEFKRMVQDMGGYGTEKTGEIIWQSTE